MKKYSKFASAALASAMTLSAMGMAVMAEDNTDWDVDIIKTITKDYGTAVPNEQFKFKVEPVGVEDNTFKGTTPLHTGIGEIEQATIGGTTQPTGNVIFDQDGDDKTTEIPVITVTNPTTPPTTEDNAKEGSITLPKGSDEELEEGVDGGMIFVHQEAFAGQDVGIYRYQISEIQGTWEDLTYSKDVYYIDVYVVNSGNTTKATGLQVYKAGEVNPTTGELVPAGVVDQSEDYDPTNDKVNTNVKKTGMNFTNDYKKSTNNNLHKFEVTKTLSGNQAKMDQKFTFPTTVTGASGEKFYWEIKNSAGNVIDHNVVTSGDTNFKPQLGHQETLVIYGLSNSDTVVVDEEGRTAATDSEGNPLTGDDGKQIYKTPDGYTVTKTDVDYVVNTGNDASSAFVNHREGVIPTGILLTAAPYTAVIGLGGVFAGLFFRRKRED